MNGSRQLLYTPTRFKCIDYVLLKKNVLTLLIVAPLVKAETQLLGSPTGSQIQLKCTIESYPPSINIWMKGRHDDHSMLLAG